MYNTSPRTGFSTFAALSAAATLVLAGLAGTARADRIQPAARSVTPLGLHNTSRSRRPSTELATQPVPGVSPERDTAPTPPRSRKAVRRAHRARPRPRRPRVSQAYLHATQTWHSAAPVATARSWQKKPVPPLTIRMTGTTEEVTLLPSTAMGGFPNDELEKAKKLFLCRRSGSEHNVHPRLLDLIYRAARHFKAPYVWLVSGYRNGRDSSRHSHGRAADIVLPGVRDTALAQFFRSQGFVGVGVYPISRFVHIDVRDKSYFWIDRSAPGSPTRAKPVMMDQAKLADLKARRRGLEPTPEKDLDLAEEASLSADEPL